MGSIPDYEGVEWVFAKLVPLDTVAKQQLLSVSQHVTKGMNARYQPWKYLAEINNTTGGTPRSARAVRPALELSLQQLPCDLREGWVVGRCDVEFDINPKVDIVLSSAADADNTAEIGSKHASFKIHPQTLKVIVTAFQPTFVGHNGMQDITGTSHTLENGQVVRFGKALYMLELTPYYRSDPFIGHLWTYMRKTQGPSWTLDHRFRPVVVSDAKPVLSGKYLHSAAPFGAGTFGTVFAGWKSSNGETVAVKKLKKPKAGKIKQHQEMMKLVGDHENIVKLIDVEVHGEGKLMAALLVYEPLALMNLAGISEYFFCSVAAKLTLLRDYCRALKYLHDEKGIMHRDLSASNLCVTSMDSPKGLIIDLDTATQDPLSIDTHAGTRAYAGPEIIFLRHFETNTSRQPDKMFGYGRDIDIWALGLNIYGLCLPRGRSWSWAPFGVKEEGMVDWEAYLRFRKELDRREDEAFDDNEKAICGWVRQMTEWDPTDRADAAELLDEVQEVLDARFTKSFITGPYALPTSLSS